MTERKTLREVLEPERLERERVRALIRDMDEAREPVRITEVHDGPHRRSTVTAPLSRVAMPVNTMRRLSQRGATLTFGSEALELYGADAQRVADALLNPPQVQEYAAESQKRGPLSRLTQDGRRFMQTFGCR